MYKGLERRKEERIAQQVDAIVLVRPHENHGKTYVGWELAAVLNLGAGGALFYTNKKVEKSESLDLQINFIRSATTINCVGKAIRVEELNRFGLFLVAVVFTEIKEKDMIRRFVRATSA